MSWLEILAASHPFILGLTMLSTLALIFSTIQTIMKKDNAVYSTVELLVILWFCAGIAYVIWG